MVRSRRIAVRKWGVGTRHAPNLRDIDQSSSIAVGGQDGRIEQSRTLRHVGCGSPSCPGEDSTLRSRPCVEGTAVQRLDRGKLGGGSVQVASVGWTVPCRWRRLGGGCRAGASVELRSREGESDSARASEGQDVRSERPPTRHAAPKSCIDPRWRRALYGRSTCAPAHLGQEGLFTD